MTNPEKISLKKIKELDALEPLSASSSYSAVPDSYDSFLIASDFCKRNRSVIVISSEDKLLDRLNEELTTLLGEKSVALLPSRDPVPYNMKSPFGPTVEKRIGTLYSLLNGERKIYLVHAASLLQKVPQPRAFFKTVIRLNKNDDIDIQDLSSWLSENDFRRESAVSDVGTFAVRGGIVDIYPFMHENPVRLEFFGDTIESIRVFDPFSQKSLNFIDSVEIFPMKEFFIDDTSIMAALKRIEKNKEISKECKDKLDHIWNLSADYDGIEWFLSLFNLQISSIPEYFSEDSMVIWNDFNTPEVVFDKIIGNYEEHLNRVPKIFSDVVSKPDELLFTQKQIIEELEFFGSCSINTSVNKEHQIKPNVISQALFNGIGSLFIRDINDKLDKGYRIIFVAQSKGSLERVSEQLEELADSVTFFIGDIHSGFVDKENGIALYTEKSVFNRYYRKYSGRRKYSPLSETGDFGLSVGDFVVHIDHGIAEYIGTERVKTESSVTDCMVLRFNKGAKVYVPLEDFEKVQKYVGQDGTTPVLSTLGTERWQKIKDRTRASLHEMAEDLIKLYAKRDAFEGITYSKDSPWQREFEDSFVYEATPDQIRSIREVKNDMEKSKPMDRLVCGDVGFGKTEVAMRAAFKATMDHYQVALLAPTTILAEQHFINFSDRMRDFPVKIGIVSRFQSRAEIKETLKKVKEGDIDILVGTHRLLSGDVEFKNLGLLIIDEEQRFGVKHKEKLKKYRYKTDVLSMSATPIPRTMQMSLLGIRDLSIIATPPSDRLPVETFVMEFHEEVIIDAVRNELARGGQVYIVHNRVNSLMFLRENLEKLVPEARTVIAHGQMDEKTLDISMREFIAGKYDILLSTTIIENGLDIPNVNTIIVDRADMLGLSQLYQLRGRVGRSSTQAFAYFLTSPFKQMSDTSLKRLKALEQYTELGSGFQIAMRDLEIRGAGNILGTGQHGFISAVGFDLYVRILKEEVDKLNGVESEDVFNVSVNLPVETYIPEEYIPDSNMRISQYKKLSEALTVAEIDTIMRNSSDRFGPLPMPFTMLCCFMKVKLYAKQLMISSVSISEMRLKILLDGSDSDIKQRSKDILSYIKHNFEIEYANGFLIKISLNSGSQTDRVFETLELFSLILKEG